MSRQTISYLQRKFAEVGLEPNARHGQNFLVDLNLLDFVIKTADLSGRDVVLEVGTGTASLTTRIAEQAGHVVSVEIDRHLYALAQEQLAGYSNVTLLQQDALRNKNHLDEQVMRSVRQAMQDAGCDRFKLVANLPYNVATSIIANLLNTEPWPCQITATVQKELAERMVAPPHTRDYSALSVWVQSLCDVRIERNLAPSVFWPRPKVQSAIINLVTRRDRRDAMPDLNWFQSFVRSLFLHRRKLLRGVLLAAYKHCLAKPTIDRILGAMDVSDQARAEQLSVEQLQRLSELVRAEIPPESRPEFVSSLE
ncbi:MAG: 16S rRNA (adenine(1518)-N(6)/adenine(1519)-N(6))-dimethyltransferase RsmA [Planctomycetota bacterium]|nr:16S rRNA (adenine(1518)-N(6)/adenine(1519)-N(6))-dimethyltransferase RsmA [Planctomycetota bacterium]MDA1179688.1 16S rRNA (adenine(1518)-N(6)/adenine(1519)-N(6))-dimethyltransferase RsmA [Planctomycetota bacterium]